MTNQLITYQFSIDYSLISQMSSMCYMYIEQRRAQMMSRKFNPRSDSDKQTNQQIPCTTSSRARYGISALVSSSAGYSVIYFAILWLLSLKMLEKTHNVHLNNNIIEFEGGWQNMMGCLWTDTLLTSIAEKSNFIIAPNIHVYHSQQSQ